MLVGLSCKISVWCSWALNTAKGWVRNDWAKEEERADFYPKNLVENKIIWKHVLCNQWIVSLR